MDKQQIIDDAINNELKHTANGVSMLRNYSELLADIQQLKDFFVESKIANPDGFKNIDDIIVFTRLVVGDFVDGENAAAEWGFDREHDHLMKWIGERMTERAEFVDELRAIKATMVKRDLFDESVDMSLADQLDDELNQLERALVHTGERSATYHDIKRIAAANGWKGGSDNNLIEWIDKYTARIEQLKIAAFDNRIVFYEKMLETFKQYGFDESDENVFDWIENALASNRGSDVQMGENWLLKFRDHGWNPDDEPLINWIDRVLGIIVELDSRPMPTADEWGKIETMVAEYAGVTHGITTDAAPRISGPVSDWLRMRLDELSTLRAIVQQQRDDFHESSIGSDQTLEPAIDRVALIRGAARLVADAVALFEQIADDGGSDE